MTRHPGNLRDGQTLLDGLVAPGEAAARARVLARAGAADLILLSAAINAPEALTRPRLRGPNGWLPRLAQGFSCPWERWRHGR
ncbi:MAG: hypothetical protein FJX53_14035, partial [Alphaproteobacteria bacterium]|nr:hypothetical protein [Alphaproteobacteria bacterium]